jgi:predicted ATPase
MVEIKGLRGWTGQALNFNFPVVAVVGENGTGKSTCLKAAACAYEGTDAKKTFYPSSFFLDTKWDAVQGVELSYRVKQGNETRSLKINKPTKTLELP